MADADDAPVRDTPLTRFLVKLLTPLSEADPSLLANYVVALLKNNMPMPELQRFCVEQLEDFLGKDASTFVGTVFQALGDGVIFLESGEGAGAHEEVKGKEKEGEVEGSRESAVEDGNGESLQGLPVGLLERSDSGPAASALLASRVGQAVITEQGSPAMPMGSQEGDEGSKQGHRRRRRGGDSSEEDDEDGDTNHRHRRRKQGDPAQDEVEGGSSSFRRPNNGAWNRPPMNFGGPNERARPRGETFPRGFGGRGSRVSYGRMGLGGRHRDGPIPIPGGPEAGFYEDFHGFRGGRGSRDGRRGGWVPRGAPGLGHPGFFHGMGGRVGEAGPRPRCPDFDERGFCLKGDLCPFDHGNCHIVVDDMQSLQQLNLPLRPDAPAVERHTGPGGLGVVPVDHYDPDQGLLWSANNMTTRGWQPTAQDGTEQAKAPGAWARIGVGTGRGEGSVALGGTGGRGAGHGLKLGRPEEGGVDGTAGPMTTGTTPSREVSGGGRGPGRVGRGNEQKGQAQTTVFVHNIPSETKGAQAALMQHFLKFGAVVDIKVNIEKGRAFVQFIKREHAEAALNAADAVMGNRFIRIHWANFDLQPCKPSQQELTAGKGSEDLAVQGGAQGTGGAGSHGEINPGSSIASAAPGNEDASNKGTEWKNTSPPASLKTQTQQEKLEHLRQIQQKKEAILRLQIEQRRNYLEKLKQHRQNQVVLETRPVGKLQETEIQEESTTVEEKDKTKPADGTQYSTYTPEPASLATIGAASVAGDNGASTAPVGSGRHPQGGRGRGYPFGHSGYGGRGGGYAGGGYYGGVGGRGGWGGGNRFKLDNRTTIIRISPPIPAVITEASMLWEHFSVLGDVVSVEVEGEHGASVTEKSHVRVKFATRAGAEWAFANGRSFGDGQELELSWAQPTPQRTPGTSAGAHAVTAPAAAPALAAESLAGVTADVAVLEAADRRGVKVETALLSLPAESRSGKVLRSQTAAVD